jgi:hypothetical protein
MVLASCAYMLRPIIKKLRDNGIPFHNPYRTTHRGWNPLTTDKANISTMDRLKAFLQPDNDNEKFSGLDRWSKDAMAMWIPLLKSKDLLYTGCKKMVEAGDFKLPVTIPEWQWIIKNEDDVHKALTLNKAWFKSNVVTNKLKAIGFPMKIIEKGFADQGPKVIVGTVHSVKGGEADHVYVFPDIAYQASLGSYDELVRLFYVAMTRAKQSLTLCGPADRLAVEW